MVEIESSRKDKRDQIFELNAEKKKITIKLDALRDFHAKRDIKVRQDLAKEQELRNNIEGDIKTFADREKFLNDQIEGRFKSFFIDGLSRDFYIAENVEESYFSTIELNFALRLVILH